MTNIKNVSSLLHGEKVLPVVVIENQGQALGLANALIDGGINSIEITLRNQYGIRAIEKIKNVQPELTVFAGTVNTCDQMRDVILAGTDGVVSAGVTSALLELAIKSEIPYLPGVTTPSEIIKVSSFGLNECKLFPASIVGGVNALKAYSGPFGEIKFCPTGGVNADNYLDYLALQNVMCVGGSWIAPSNLVKAHDWAAITKLCKGVSSV